MRRRGSISLPPEMSDVKIMLLGSTGSGKSATGNTIIGGDRRPFEEEFSPEPVTIFCDSKEAMVNGQRITVFDTAGLSDTSVKITDAQIEEMLRDGVDVFLLVIKLGQTFTETDMKVVKWIQDNFGEKFSDHAIVLFTHGDQLHVSMERYLNKSESLQSVVDQCSKRYHVFNNKDEDPSQVTELLKDINKLRETPGYRRYSEQDYKETQVLFKFSALGAQIHDIGTRLDDAAAMPQLDAARAAGAPGGAPGVAAAARLGREAGVALAVVAGLRRAGLGSAAVEAAGAAVAVGIGGTVFTGPKRGAALAAAVGAGVYFARKYYYREKR